VDLNAGTNKGLRTGMELLVIEPINVVESVRIHEGGREPVRSDHDQVGEGEPGPKVGWRFPRKLRGRIRNGPTK